MMIQYGVHLKNFNKRICDNLSIDGVFRRHGNTHLSKPINYHKLMVMSLVLGKPPTKSKEILSHGLIGIGEGW